MRQSLQGSSRLNRNSLGSGRGFTNTNTLGYQIQKITLDSQNHDNKLQIQNSHQVNSLQGNTNLQTSQDQYQKIPKKIIVKKSRHIREASHDVGMLSSQSNGLSLHTPGSGQNTFLRGSSSNNYTNVTSVTPSQVIQLPPMIKTPKDRNERNHTIINHTNLQPITPNINSAGGYRGENQANMYNINTIQQHNNSSGQQSSITKQNEASNQVFTRFSNVQMHQQQAQNRNRINSSNVSIPLSYQNSHQQSANFYNNSTNQAQLSNAQSIIQQKHQNKQLPHHEKSQSLQLNSGLQNTTFLSQGSSTASSNTALNRVSNELQDIQSRTFSPKQEMQSLQGSSATESSQLQSSSYFQQRDLSNQGNSVPIIRNVITRKTQHNQKYKSRERNQIINNLEQSSQNNTNSSNGYNTPQNQVQQDTSNPMENSRKISTTNTITNVEKQLSSNKSSKKIEKISTKRQLQTNGSGHSKNEQQQQPQNLNQDLQGVGKSESNVKFVDVQTLIFGDNPVIINPQTIQLKNHEVTKASNKSCGMIRAYAANTNQGIIRDYNEDRVSIILNIVKPKNKILTSGIEWPQICFFGVFDGHGGAACADYLRDSLHNFVINNPNFPQNPKDAIVQGFKECEYNYLSMVETAYNRQQVAHYGSTQQEQHNQGLERSGSCAIVVMIIDDMIHIANVGDSRCLMSVDCGNQIAVLSRDHKPDDELEKQRIQLAGGKIYRTQTFAKQGLGGEKDSYVQGPLRVFPGRLSVARTFGDIEAKLPRFGGNPNVIVCDPEIRSFKLQENHFDFIVIGCDGIFDRLNNRDVVDSVWESAFELQKQNQKASSQSIVNSISPQPLLTQKHQALFNSLDKKKLNLIETARQSKIGTSGNLSQQSLTTHIVVAEGVELVLKKAAASRSLDNITTLILGFKNFERAVQKIQEGHSLQQIRENQLIENQISQGPFNLIDDYDIIPENFVYNQKQFINESLQNNNTSQPSENKNTLQKLQSQNMKPQSQNSFSSKSPTLNMSGQSSSFIKQNTQRVIQISKNSIQNRPRNELTLNSGHMRNNSWQVPPTLQSEKLNQEQNKNQYKEQ